MSAHSLLAEKLILFGDDGSESRSRLIFPLWVDAPCLHVFNNKTIRGKYETTNMTTTNLSDI